MVVADIVKGIDFSKACKQQINCSPSADHPKNILVMGLHYGERGPDFKGLPRNGVIRSVNGSVVLKNNGEIWSKGPVAMEKHLVFYIGCRSCPPEKRVFILDTIHQQKVLFRLYERSGEEEEEQQRRKDGAHRFLP